MSTASTLESLAISTSWASAATVSSSRERPRSRFPTCQSPVWRNLIANHTLVISTSPDSATCGLPDAMAPDEDTATLPLVDVHEHLDALRREGDRLGAAAAATDLDPPIPTCPEWRGGGPGPHTPGVVPGGAGPRGATPAN